jgi:hypothetical protein
MEITARRKLVFNLGKYEQAETEFTITGIPHATGPEEISRMLDLLMQPEVDKVVLATAHHPDDNATGVYTWQEITEKSREDTHA